MSLSIRDKKLFFKHKQNIYTFFMILFGWFDLILLFVMWIVKHKIEISAIGNIGMCEQFIVGKYGFFDLYSTFHVGWPSVAFDTNKLKQF